MMEGAFVKTPAHGADKYRLDCYWNWLFIAVAVAVVVVVVVVVVRFCTAGFSLHPCIHPLIHA